MELTEVLGKLCYKDPRNPEYAVFYGWQLSDGILDTPPTPRENCYCDNCFSGCDRLAVEILRLRDENEAMDKTINSLV